MKVERKEIYDFLVVLDAAEFEQVKEKAVELDITVEAVLLDIFTCGFCDYFDN